MGYTLYMSPTKLNSTTISLVLGDILIFSISLVIALTVRSFAIPESAFFIQHIYPFSLVLLIWIALFIVGGMYDQTYLTIKRSIGSTLATLQLVGGGIAILLFYLVPTFAVTPKTNLALFLVFFSLGIWVWRKLFFTHIQPVTARAVLIGEHPHISRVLSKDNMYGISINQHISWNNLSEIEKPLDILLCDFSDDAFQTNAKAIQQLVMNGVRVVDTQRLLEKITGRISLQNVTSQWFISRVQQPARSYLFMKRLVDLVCGFVLLALLIIISPLLLPLMFAMDKHTSFLFMQKRVGLLGEPFVMFKLRTMSVADSTTWSSDNHQHITRLGSVLRALRIDEWPQAINLIRGDMSLVGPRALMISEQENMEQVVPSYSQRLFLKPGITGWAQVKQNKAPANEKEASERLSYDLYYLVHASILFDLLIVLKTVKTIILKTGMRS